MAKRWIGNILDFAGKGVGLVAAIAGIAAVGWYAAVGYYNLSSQVSSIAATSKITEQSIAIDDFRRKMADLTEENKTLRTELAEVKRLPTDEDWDTLCFRSLQLFGDVCRALNELSFASTLDGQKAKGILNDTRVSFNSIMTGARMIANKQVGDDYWIYMKKCPNKTVNWRTGEMRDMGSLPPETKSAAPK
jgi:hypothetical protein